MNKSAECVFAGFNRKGEVVGLSGPELNHFFEVLAQWETILQAENQNLGDDPETATKDATSDKGVA